jgi:predicted PurR-regulated permease PerM
MKPQYFIAILFIASLYWMYLLYAPFLMVITIAALLGVSTASIYAYFEQYTNSRLVASIISSLLLAILFFVPLGYFLATLTIKLNTLEVSTLQQVELYIKSFLVNPPEYLPFLKSYFSDFIKDIDMNAITTKILLATGKVGYFSAGFVENAFLIIIFYFFALYNAEIIVDFLKRVLL